jgi:hypothetical protein
MHEYTVVWAVQVSADNHEDAARRARARQLDPQSIADVFEVTHELPGAEPRTVDLSALDGRSVD